MINYKEMLLTLIGSEIEDKYHVEVIDILPDVIFRKDKDDPFDFVDFSMSVLMIDEKDYNTRVYRVKGFFSYENKTISIVTRKLLAD